LEVPRNIFASCLINIKTKNILKHKHVISSRLYRYDAVFGKQSKLDLKLVLEV